MAGPRRIGRRQLARNGAVGAVIGAVWATGLRAMSLPDVPTVSLIGANGSQIALVDTTEVRALVLLGTPAGALVERIPSLLTLHRQRLDLVIGSADAVDALPARSLRGDFHALVVDDPTLANPAPGTSSWTLLRSGTALTLGSQVEARLRLSPRRRWLAADGSQPEVRWALELRHLRNRVLLAPSAEAAVAAGRPRPAVLITPGDDPRLAIDKLMPLAVAFNAEEAPEGSASKATLVRVFPDEIARLELREEGVRLPVWAEQAHSSDSGRS